MSTVHYSTLTVHNDCNAFLYGTVYLDRCRFTRVITRVNCNGPGDLRS